MLAASKMLAEAAASNVAASNQERCNRENRESSSRSSKERERKRNSRSNSKSSSQSSPSYGCTVKGTSAIILTPDSIVYNDEGIWSHRYDTSPRPHWKIKSFLYGDKILTVKFWMILLLLWKFVCPMRRFRAPNFDLNWRMQFLKGLCNTTYFLVITYWFLYITKVLINHLIRLYISKTWDTRYIYYITLTFSCTVFKILNTV